MIIAILLVLGLCMGSFVNALVWRIHEQEMLKPNKKNKTKLNKLSITTGRSMCPHCEHELKAADLLPVISWIGLKGKCRYCKRAISVQYPIVELSTAVIFLVSYISWPAELNGAQIVLFGLWLTVVVGLIALLVYDLKWMILPNRLVYPLSAISGLMALITISISTDPLSALISIVLSVTVGGGIFYVLYQVSDGKWIGGGDIKLGWMIGLLLGTPARSFLMIFIAALLGTLICLPLLALHRLKKNSTVPFGPFLIVSVIIVQLYGHAILTWYQQAFLPFTI